MLSIPILTSYGYNVGDYIRIKENKQIYRIYSIEKSNTFTVIPYNPSQENQSYITIQKDSIIWRKYSPLRHYCCDWKKIIDHNSKAEREKEEYDALQKLIGSPGRLHDNKYPVIQTTVHYKEYPTHDWKVKNLSPSSKGNKYDNARILSYTLPGEKTVSIMDIIPIREDTCFNCKEKLDEKIAKDCQKCRWYLCTNPKCGVCGCHHTSRKDYVYTPEDLIL